jgi:hypothetical protein
MPAFVETAICGAAQYSGTEQSGAPGFVWQTLL